MGKVPLPKISPSGENTKEVQTFIDEFIEGTSLNSNLNNEFKEFLEENKGWTEWKFFVRIQIISTSL